MIGYSGGVMSFGGGAAISGSKKQKLNTRSSTEAELVGADDFLNLIFWTKLFPEEQGHAVENNILCQDNKSAIPLETNGKRSSSNRTRALNICYFFLTDQVEKKMFLLNIVRRSKWSETLWASLCKVNFLKNFEPPLWATTIHFLTVPQISKDRDCGRSALDAFRSRYSGTESNH